MKWVCVANDISMLTYGKIYDNITNEFVDTNCILVKDDFGVVSEYYQPGSFVTIQEWRNNQLENLDI